MIWPLARNGMPEGLRSVDLYGSSRLMRVGASITAIRT